MKNSETEPVILVLTQLGKRDREVADAALALAIKLQKDIILFNCFPITSGSRANIKFAEILEIEVEKEVLRLRVILEKKKQNMIDVRCRVADGELSECVYQFGLSEKIAFIVMGGKPLRDDNDYFCTDVRDIIHLMSCPVVVVPEGSSSAFN